MHNSTPEWRAPGWLRILLVAGLLALGLFLFVANPSLVLFGGPILFLLVVVVASGDWHGLADLLHQPFLVPKSLDLTGLEGDVARARLAQYLNDCAVFEFELRQRAERSSSPHFSLIGSRRRVPVRYPAADSTLSSAVHGVLAWHPCVGSFAVEAPKQAGTDRGKATIWVEVRAPEKLP